MSTQETSRIQASLKIGPEIPSLDVNPCRAERGTYETSDFPEDTKTRRQLNQSSEEHQDRPGRTSLEAFVAFVSPRPAICLPMTNPCLQKKHRTCNIR